MPVFNGLSDDDRKEVYEDRCASYANGSISMSIFIQELAKLGYNASDIYEAEKFYRPTPPENDDGETG